MTAESEYQRCARGLREAAEMARKNARACYDSGHWYLALQALNRAHRYEVMADRDLKTERMMKDGADDESELFA